MILAEVICQDGYTNLSFYYRQIENFAEVQSEFLERVHKSGMVCCREY